MHLERFFVAGSLAALAGCALGEIHATFGTSAPVPVTIGCGAVVEAFENPAKRLVMVRSNAPAEVSGLTCFGSRQAMIRKAVETYFVDTKRPTCVAAEQTELSPWHHQFSYTCPAG